MVWTISTTRPTVAAPPADTTASPAIQRTPSCTVARADPSTQARQPAFGARNVQPPFVQIAIWASRPAQAPVAPGPTMCA